MLLVCNVCAPTYKDWNYYPEEKKKGVFIMGKWYPGVINSYQNFAKEDFGIMIQEFIIKHNHNNEEYPFRIDYEAPKE